MIINRYNSAEICRIAEHCSGIATRLSLDDMSHPRGILAHIVNFFNNGCVIRDNVKQYNAFAQQMTKALVEHKNAGISPPNGLPERLVVKYLGYTVLFSLPGENHNAAGPVTIEVSKGREKAEADLTAKAMPLMDILSKAPYTGDTGINAWLGTLCEQYLSQYNERLLPENEGVFNQSVDLWVFPDHGGYLCNGRCTYVDPWMVACNVILCENLLGFLNFITKACNENNINHYSNTFSI